MRALLKMSFFSLAIMITTTELVRAQTIADAAVNNDSATPSFLPPSSLFAYDRDSPAQQKPAGPPPTPRHTGIKAMVKGLVIDFKYLPSKENLYWAATGGGLALAAHPFDDDVNHKLVGVGDKHHARFGLDPQSSRCSDCARVVCGRLRG